MRTFAVVLLLGTLSGAIVFGQSPKPATTSTPGGSSAPPPAIRQLLASIRSADNARLTPGGLFLAHNVINKKSEMGDFLAAIETHPQAITSIVSAGHEGISMTVRRR